MKFRLFISSVQKEFTRERREIARYVRKDALFGKFFDVFLFEESIAGPMYLKGYIEKMGTGTEDVAKLCAKSGLPAPGFTEGVDFRAVLKRKSLSVVTETQVGTQVKTHVGTQVKQQVLKLIGVFRGDMATSELMRLVGIRQRKNFHAHYISEALQTGLVEMTQPNSPRSPTQRYRLTAKGRELLASMSSNGEGATP